MSRFTKIENTDDQWAWSDTVAEDYDSGQVQISGLKPPFESRYYAGTSLKSAPNPDSYFVGEPWLVGDKTWIACAKFERVEFQNWNGDTLAHVKIGLDLHELDGQLEFSRTIDARPAVPTVTNYRDAARLNKAGAPGNDFTLSGPTEEEGVGDGLADSGRSAWARITDAQADFYGLIQFGEIFVPQYSFANQIYAINSENGEKIWEKLGWQNMPPEAAAYCQGNPDHKRTPPWASSPEWWSERFTSIGKVGENILIHRQRSYWNFESYSDFWAHPLEHSMSSPGQTGHPSLPDYPPSTRTLRYSSWDLKWWTVVIGGGSVELLAGTGGEIISAFGKLSPGFPRNVVVNQACGNQHVLPNSAEWEWQFQTPAKVANELADMANDLDFLATKLAWAPATPYKVESFYELLNPLTGEVMATLDLDPFSDTLQGEARHGGIGTYTLTTSAGAGGPSSWKRLTQEDHEPQTGRNQFAPADVVLPGFSGGVIPSSHGLGRSTYLFYEFAGTQLYNTFVGPCIAIGAEDEIWVQMPSGISDPWNLLPAAREWTAMHVVRNYLRQQSGERQYKKWKAPLPWHSGKMATSVDGSKIYFFPRAFPTGFLPLKAEVGPSNTWQDSLHQIACFDAATLEPLWAVDVKPFLGTVPTGTGGRKSTFLGAMISSPLASADELGGIFIGALGETALKFDSENGAFLGSDIKLLKNLTGSNQPPLTPSLVSGDSVEGGCWWDTILVVDSRLLGIRADGFWQAGE